ncbi:MAG: hypothetical protein O9266_04330 [Porphyrobacter sp.]|nr:hypothetical protein [Porphyrobacter sp.]
MKSGLDAITETEAEFAVQVSGKYSFDDLKAALERFANEAEREESSEDRIELTRASALGLLHCLLDSLSAPMRQPLVDDPSVRLDHPAITLLRDLADAIEDLDRQKTHTALKRSSGKRGGSDLKRLRREKEERAIALEIIKKEESLSFVGAEERFKKPTRRSGKPSFSIINQRKGVRKRKRKES